jgi:hypothetical protein
MVRQRLIDSGELEAPTPPPIDQRAQKKQGRPRTTGHSGPAQASKTGPHHVRHAGTAAKTEPYVRASEMHRRGFTINIKQSAVHRKPVPFLVKLPDSDCHGDADP